MTILTIESRNQIATAVLKHAFTERCIDVAIVANALCNKIYDRIYTQEDRKAIALLQARFEEFMTVRAFSLSVGGMALKVGTRDDTRHNFPLELDRFVPVEMIDTFVVIDKHRNARVLNMEADDELGIACLDWAQAREALQSQINERRAEIMGVLNKARTDGQLEAIWPEVMPIAREFVKAKEAVNLPAIPVANLNAVLGLPVTAAA
jgi:hypothetical protein